MCTSYETTMMYKASKLFYRPPLLLSPNILTFIQYAADDADISINTFDGNNILHIVGIFQTMAATTSVLLY